MSETDTGKRFITPAEIEAIQKIEDDQCSLCWSLIARRYPAPIQDEPTSALTPQSEDLE